MNWSLLQFIIIILVVVLHIIAVVWLLQRKCRRVSESQRLFLINLSLSEILIAGIGLLRRLFALKTSQRIDFYMILVQNTGCILAYYLIMIILTADRFFEVYLNIRYPIFWNGKRSRYIMCFVWLVSFIVSVISIAIQQSITIEEFFKFCYVYYFPIAELIFLIVATTTYSYVLKLIRRNRLQRLSTSVRFDMTECCINTGTQNRRKRVRKMRGFVVPTLLIITFILFVIVPDLIYFFSYILKRPVHSILDRLLPFIYYFGFSSDAFIYILFHPSSWKRTYNSIRRHFSMSH